MEGVSRISRPAEGAPDHHFQSHGIPSIFLAWVAGMCFIGLTFTGIGQSFPDSTPEMARRLASIHSRKNPERNSYLSLERAGIYQKRLDATTDAQSRITALWELASEQLNAAQNEAALENFLEVEKLAQIHKPDFYHNNKLLLWHHQALCHLRIGELDNCLNHHSPDSCIFPLAGGGIHKLTRGAEGAVAVLTKILQENPSDVGNRWLLNVAYMALGQYPDQVPPAYLIDAGRFESSRSIGRFRDVAGILHLDRDSLCGGSIMEDLNLDGLLDIVVSDWSLTSEISIHLNLGNGQFRQLTSEESGLKGITGGLNLIHADYNNDGLPDILVLRGAWRNTEGRIPNSLLLNRGQGRFQDVTIESGLYSAKPTQTATWFDYNNDGWLDLFIGNESSDRRSRHPCELFRNNRDGTFTECARSMKLDYTGYIKAVVSADYNNDGWMDLYLSDIEGKNKLFRNDGPSSVGGPVDGPWTFTDVSSQAGIENPVKSFPAWFFDFNNDGWQDIFVCGYTLNYVDDIAADYLGLPNNTVKPHLYKNLGNGTFADVTQEYGLNKAALAMGCNFGDLNNDGFLDFYLGTGNPLLSTLVPNRMFLNRDGEFFDEITTSGGFGHLQKGHGISFGDIDNDGDQDVHATMGGALSGDNYRNVLFENPGHKNQWIKLKLTGTQSNKAAIGARVEISWTSTSTSRRNKVFRNVSTGGSFGANPFRLEVGLGADPMAGSVQVAITWPNSTSSRQQFNQLNPNQFYELTEGQPDAVVLPLPRFSIPGPDAQQHGPHPHH